MAETFAFNALIQRIVPADIKAMLPLCGELAYKQHKYMIFLEGVPPWR